MNAFNKLSAFATVAAVLLVPAAMAALDTSPVDDSLDLANKDLFDELDIANVEESDTQMTQDSRRRRSDDGRRRRSDDGRRRRSDDSRRRRSDDSRRRRSSSDAASTSSSNDNDQVCVKMRDHWAQIGLEVETKCCGCDGLPDMLKWVDSLSKAVYDWRDGRNEDRAAGRPLRKAISFKGATRGIADMCKCMMSKCTEAKGVNQAVFEASGPGDGICNRMKAQALKDIHDCTPGNGCHINIEGVDGGVPGECRGCHGYFSKDWGDLLQVSSPTASSPNANSLDELSLTDEASIKGGAKWVDFRDSVDLGLDFGGGSSC